MTTGVGIIGATGRMGHALIRAVQASADVRLVAAVARRGHAAVGADALALAGAGAGAVRISDDLTAVLPSMQVAIDFSRAGNVPASAAACAAAGVALLVGTTGLDAEGQASLDAAAARIPVLLAPNTSLALNVLLELVQRAARALPPGYDIEVVESHHRHKIDAPSGTALALGDAAAAGRGLPRADAAITGVQPGPRAGGVGYAVVRGGDVVGEHDVRFLGPGEQLRLMHVATDRAIFAQGAVAAAAWLAQRAPGRYRMSDFLFGNQ